MHHLEQFSQHGTDHVTRSIGEYIPLTETGEESAQWWADRYVESDSIVEKAGYGFGGLLASLWTRETAVDTATTLLTMGGLAKGIHLAVKGSWRAFGNTMKLLRNPRNTFKFRHVFFNNKTFSSVSRQYWRASKGAKGKALHHWMFQNQSKWVPRWMRNSAFNLLEIPGEFNTWMGGRFLREVSFRLVVLRTIAESFDKGMDIGRPDED